MDFDVVVGDKIHPSWAVEAVDGLLKRLKDKPLWDGVDFIVKTLYKYRGQYMRSFEVTQRDRNALRRDTGASDDLGMRHLTSLPPLLTDTIDYFYGDDVRYDEKRFWREFARRYPQFRIPEKI